MRVPAIPICLAFVCGIVLPPLASPAVAFATALLALAGARACAGRDRVLAGSACVILAFAVLGNVAAELHARAVERSELRVMYGQLGERATVQAG